MLRLEYGRDLLFKLNHIPFSKPVNGGSNGNGIGFCKFSEYEEYQTDSKHLNNKYIHNEVILQTFMKREGFCNAQCAHASKVLGWLRKCPITKRFIICCLLKINFINC